MSRSANNDASCDGDNNITVLSVDVCQRQAISMIQKEDLFKKQPHGEPGLSKFLQNPYALYKAARVNSLVIIRISGTLDIQMK